MGDRKSEFKFYSLGIVLEDKPIGSDQVKIVPIEALTQLNGSLKDAKINYDVDMPDHKGVNRQTKMEGGAFVAATWFPDGNDNRITSPDVYASETVQLWRMGDTNEYQWKTLYREPKLRRLETVQYAYSNLPDFGTAFDNDTSYWALWDTRNKKVQFHTANNDGEPVTWDLTFDAANGVFSIQDDASHLFQIDAVNNIMTMSQPEASFVMDKGHVTLTCLTWTVNASESITETTPSMTINGDTTTINGETTNNGSFTVNGLATLNEGLKGKGGAEFTGGDMDISGGSVKIDGSSVALTGGSITANGEDLIVDLT